MTGKTWIKRMVVAIVIVAALCSTMLPAAATDSVLPFGDVGRTDWHYGAVAYVYANNIMSGTAPGAFSPNKTMTRAMFVTVLYRHSKEQSNAQSSFVDVAQGQWYTEAVSWAASKGIVAGTDEHHFQPDGAITREQMTCILYRYAAEHGYDTTVNASLEQYTDNMTVSSYAVDAVKWALGQGIMSGTSHTSISPLKTATRAEAATLLSRFCINTQVQPQPPVPVVEEPLPEPDESQIVQVGEQRIFIGMSRSELLTQCGEPAEQLLSAHGFVWYVYNTASYHNFFAAGIDNGSIVAIYAEGREFNYMGFQGCSRNSAGETAALIQKNGMGAQIDRVDGNCMYAVYLRGGAYRYEYANAKALQDEARMKFHLVNTYRTIHELPLLLWDDGAGAAAEKHSIDMMQNSYVSHTAPDGSSSADRISAENIEWSFCGENIVVGMLDSLEAHNRLLNSQGHRENILSRRYTHVGVGAAFVAHLYYVFYFTEDYWG